MVLLIVFSTVVLSALLNEAYQIYRYRDQPEKEFFVNSSLEQFAAFLVLHRRLLSETARAATEMSAQSNADVPTEAACAKYEMQIGDYLAHAKHHMGNLDSTAIAESESNYWPRWLKESDDWGKWEGDELLELWCGSAFDHTDHDDLA